MWRRSPAPKGGDKKDPDCLQRVARREAARSKVSRQEQTGAVQKQKTAWMDTAPWWFPASLSITESGRQTSPRDSLILQQPKHAFQVRRRVRFAHRSSPANFIWITVGIHECSLKLPGWPQNPSLKQFRLCFQSFFCREQPKCKPFTPWQSQQNWGYFRSGMSHRRFDTKLFVY